MVKVGENAAMEFFIMVSLSNDLTQERQIKASYLWKKSKWKMKPFSRDKLNVITHLKKRLNQYLMGRNIYMLKA